MKSGPLGTSMFSRSGKCTNYSYVCFNNSQGVERPDPVVVEDEEAQMREVIFEKTEEK